MYEHSVTTLGALSDQYHVVAHNLANANTVGYKRRFPTMTYDDGAAGAPTAASGIAGTVGETMVDFTQGNMVRTGRPLDVALHGKGFLVLETPDGPRYTRNGTLQIDPERKLVDGQGRAFLGRSGPIILPPTASAMTLHIGEDGTLSAEGRTFGRLKVVRFEQTQGLIPEGHSAYRAPKKTTPQEDPETLVQQGFQEASNVEVVEELVGLIRLSRLYEANVKAIQAQGERSQNILQVAMA